MAAPILVASYLLRGLRWHYLFPDDVRARGLSHATGILLIGFLLNDFLPARAGELRNFTGIDAVYEAPQAPEIHLDGQQLVTNLIAQLLDLLRREDIIKS